jgi:hypothetical protein
MVHALSETRRVLVPNGIMIDLRPIMSNWPIEVVSARQICETGQIQDMPIGRSDDEAANRSVARAEQSRWFTRDAEEFFSFYYGWDSPSEMEQWISEEWRDVIQLDEESKRATRSAWALGDADAIVRVKAKMLITRWKKERTGEDK